METWIDKRTNLGWQVNPPLLGDVAGSKVDAEDLMGWFLSHEEEVKAYFDHVCHKRSSACIS